MESDRKCRILFIGEASFLATGFSTYWHEVLKRLYATDEFEIAEFGSYAHDDDPRCQQVPWKFYPVAPARSNQQAMQKYSSNPTSQFGEIKFDDVCLDFKPDIVCFPPSTLVETDVGYTSIKDIKNGDNVLTHKGRFKKVINTIDRRYDGDLINIRCAFNNMFESMTPDHPVLSIKYIPDTYKSRKNNKKRKERHTLDFAKFYPASELQVGDYVVIPIGKYNNQSSQFLDLSLYINDDDNIIINTEDLELSSGSRGKKIPRKIVIDADISYFFGLYCAEGHVDENRGSIHLSFNSLESKLINKTISVVDKTFGLSCKTENMNSRGTCTRVTFNSKILAKIFKRLFGHMAKNKRVPNFLYKNNSLIIKSFLRGLFDGDGHITDDKIEYTTASLILARQVQSLLRKNHLAGTLHHRIRLPSPNSLVKKITTSYEILLSGKYAKIFLDKDTTITKQHRGYRGWFEDNYFIVPITKINKKKYSGQVYNLEVEKDNSYVTGFSVHNCGIRDWWMDEFVLRSPFRKNFKFIWMPTIDGEPQRELWLDSYRQCDSILTYSEYGMNLLKKTGRRGTNLITIASPGADLEVFKPPENKRDHKARLGIDPNSLIVGTVMRNQKRKLYYDLIEAFGQWLNLSKNKGHTELAKKTFLYLHTSYPDVGYDIGKAIRDFKIGNKVIMTYLCSNCKTAYPSFFAGELTICRKCGKLAAHPPNANHSCPRNVLADIMKTFDLYVQYSISEGWGMPLTEAQACGVPTMAVRYSAMEDHLQCPTSIPIEVERFFWEAIIETEQRRALPNNNDFVNKLDRFLKQSESIRDEKIKQTRTYIEELVDTYGQDIKMRRRGWERTAAIWGQVIRETDIKDQKTTWLCPTSQTNNPNLTAPSNNMNNSEFVNWVIGKIWNRPDMLHTHFAGEWLKSLNSGSRTMGDRRVPFDRKAFVEHFMEIIRQDNMIEEKRLASLNREIPDQIKVTVM